MSPSVAAAIITGTIASPSSPSVRLTALPKATMTNGPNSRNAQPKSNTKPLTKGTASPAAPLAPPRHSEHPGNAGCRLLRDFQIVAVEADHGEARGDEQHDPHVRALEIGPQQSGDKEAEQDHEAAHGGRTFFAEKVRRRSIGPNRLPLALFQPQRGDDRRTEEEDEEKS